MTTLGTGGRLVAVGCVTAAALALAAAPAVAHTRTAETTNVASRVTHAPLPDGVTLTVHAGGFLVELANATAQTVVVTGYDGEPFLRIGPDGVDENVRSPAAWLDESRYGTVAMPPSVDSSATPSWRHVDDEPRWIWHDHRTHWMSPRAPAFVDASPVMDALMRLELVGPVGRASSDAGPFATWTMPLLIDGVPVTVTGELVWTDPPRAWPWLLGAAVLIGAVVGPRGRSSELLVRRTGLVVAAIALANTIHLVDDVVAFPADLLDELFGVLHTTFFLALGTAGGLWAWRGRSANRLALGIGAGAVGYHQGLVHLPMLAAAHVPTVWPDPFLRATVALAAMQTLAVTVVLWRSRPRIAPAAPVTSPTGVRPTRPDD